MLLFFLHECGLQPRQVRTSASVVRRSCVLGSSETICWKVAQTRFLAFSDTLAAEIDSPFTRETGKAIQDASFHSQLIFEWGTLRFSNFGDMIGFTPDHEAPPAVMDSVERLAKENGYILIPTDVLEKRYTGKNPGVTGIRDWWIRYFDWV